MARYKVQRAQLLLEAYRAGVMPATLPAPGTSYDTRGRPARTERARDFLWRVVQDPFSLDE